MCYRAVYDAADQSDVLEADAELIATTASKTFDKYALFSSLGFLVVIKIYV